MSTVNGIGYNNTPLNILDNRIARHTIGRVDAIFRTIIGAWAITAQSVKLVLKSAVCVLTLGQLSKTFSFEALLLDAAFLGALVCKTALAFRDIFVAPKEGYVSFPKGLLETVNTTLGGTYHEVCEEKPSYSPWEKAQTIITAPLKGSPFFVVTDEGIAKHNKERQAARYTR